MQGKCEKALTAVRNLPERERMLMLSLVVGCACGAAAVLLQKVIHLLQHLLFPSSSGIWLYLLLPGAGMLLSLLFCSRLLKDDIGHGVTKVLLAVSRNDSRIKPHNMYSSVLASSLTIGFGGSVGAEAPIVYTGAAIGSCTARWLGLSYRNITTMIGCGAAGAIAGIFKAPLAGVLFTLEVLLFNISMTSMMPLLLSTVSAVTVAYLLTGSSTPFTCTLAPFSMGDLPSFILLGILAGGCSIYFIRHTLSLEDRISGIKSPWLRWAVCAAGLGLLIYLFPPLFGEGYQDIGVLLNGGEIDFEGRTPMEFLLRREWTVPVFFLLVLLFKVFSMTFTNSGGGVGGTFGPTLFVGALTGFVLARTLNIALPGVFSLPEQNFVLVGMAAVMAGVMQAPMTAIFLIAEMTGGYQLLLPLIVASTISFGTTRIVEKYSIYTKRIARSGDLLTHDSDQAVLTLLKVSDLVEDGFIPVHIDDTLGTLVEAVSESTRNIFPVIDSKDRFQGYVSLEDIRKEMFHPELYDTRHVFNFVRTAPEYVYEGEKMESVMKKFERTGAWNLPVVRKDRTYIGFLSKSKIFSAYREELRLVSQD